MTALEIVQEVQKRLGMPQSATLTTTQAKQFLGFANTVQRDMMADGRVWDELKSYGTFPTVDGTGTYAISIANNELDVLRNLQIGTSKPLKKFSSDEDFIEYRRQMSGSKAQPLAYRIRTRSASAGTLTVEVAPVPDAVYTVDYELLIKPLRLTAQGDAPLLDSDCVVLVTLFLARKQLGEDFSADLGAFQAKLSLLGGSQGDSDFGDVEAV